MPVRKTRALRKRRQTGAGLLSNVWKGIKSAVKYLRKSHLISKGANALDSLGVPYAGNVGKISSAIGFGRRRKIKQRGSGLVAAGGSRKPVRRRKTVGYGLRLSGAGKRKKRVGRPRKRVFP